MANNYFEKILDLGGAAVEAITSFGFEAAHAMPQAKTANAIASAAYAMIFGAGKGAATGQTSLQVAGAALGGAVAIALGIALAPLAAVGLTGAALAAALAAAGSWAADHYFKEYLQTLTPEQVRDFTKMLGQALNDAASVYRDDKSHSENIDAITNKMLEKMQQQIDQHPMSDQENLNNIMDQLRGDPDRNQKVEDLEQKQKPFMDDILNKYPDLLDPNTDELDLFKQSIKKAKDSLDLPGNGPGGSGGSGDPNDPSGGGPGGSGGGPGGSGDPTDPAGGGSDGMPSGKAPFEGKYPAPGSPQDPLVFTFGVNLPALTSVVDSTTHYDYGGQGFSVQTGWIGPSSALLEWVDSSGNLVLLGVQSGNGFGELAALDANADARIDANDAAFGQLRLWFDANGNGSVNPGELMSLADTGVSAINLSTQGRNVLVNGNSVIASATFEYASGQAGTVYEVNFATSGIHSVYSPPAGFEYDLEVLSLPHLRGYGLLPDLHIAMSLDPQLKSMVTTLVDTGGSMTGSQFQAAMTAMLYRWAGAEGLDPGSRGPNVDARQFAFVLKVYGIDPDQPGAYTNANPNWHNGAIDGQIFADMMGEMAVRLASQIDYSLQSRSITAGGPSAGLFDVFHSVFYNRANDRVSFDLPSLVADIATNLPVDATEAQQYLGLASFLLQGLRLDAQSQLGLDPNQFAGRIAIYAELADLPAAMTQALVQPIVGGPFVVADLNAATGLFSVSSGTGLLVLGGDTVSSPAGDPLTVTGSNNGDAYVYWQNVGRDVTVADNRAVLELADLERSDVVMQRIGYDLVLQITSTGHTLTFQGQFHTAGGLQQIWFSDGESLDWQELIEGTPLLVGAGTVSMRAEDGDRTVVAGSGDGTITAGNGTQTYVYNAGSGNLTLQVLPAWYWDTSKLKSLQFGDLNVADLSFLRSGTNLVVTVNSTGKTITMANELGVAGTAPVAGQTTVGGAPVLDDVFAYAIGQIKFADGTIWDRTDIRLNVATQAGTAANDTLTGSAIADTLIGGLGNDTLQGGNGDDFYIWRRGDGNDTIVDPVNGGIADRLVLRDVDPADVSLVRGSNGDLTLVVAPSSVGGNDGGSLLLKAELDENAGQGVDYVAFAGGTIWGRADLRAMVLQQAKTAGDDTITGFAADDRFEGGLGNDTLSGLTGSDTYAYNAGDGDDRIYEAGNYYDRMSVDKLVLGEGLTADKLTIARNGANLTLSFTGETGSIYLDTEDGVDGSGVEQVVFGDGTVWSRADLFAAYVRQQETAGNDTVTGFSGSDTIQGGLGDDSLYGTTGADTYVYNAGDGNDRIYEAGIYYDRINSDRLVLGTGLTVDKLQINHTNANLTLTFTGVAGSIYLDGQDGVDGAGIEQVVFGDGTTWSADQLKAAAIAQAQTTGNDTIYGFLGADTLQGKAGNDSLYGGTGSDSYIYNAGDGADRIYEAGNYYDQASVDRLVLGAGLTADKLQIARSGASLTLSFTGQTGSIYLDAEDTIQGGGVEQIVFGDGTVWSNQDLFAAYIAKQVAAGATSITGFDLRADTLTGTAGNDTLQGQDGADTLQGKGGNDALYGGVAADIYLYNGGDGNDTIYEAGNYYDRGSVDTLRLGAGIGTANVTLSRNGNTVTLNITPPAGGGAAGSVTLDNELDATNGQGVEQVVFADGTVWTRATIQAMVVSQSGTSGNDTITGTNAADVISGGLGDDTLNGGLGADTYLYNSGDGNDRIYDGGTYSDSGSVDKLVLGDGLTQANTRVDRSGTSLTLSFSDRAGSIYIDGEDGVYNPGVDKVIFGDSTSWSRTDLFAAYLTQHQTAANDTVTGFSGADTLQGGLGDDSLTGGTGADTYVYNAGDGNDRIYEVGNYYDQSSVDKLVLGAGLTADKLLVARSGTSLTLSFTGQTGSIYLDQEDTIQGGGVEQVVFGDGTVWTNQDLFTAYIAQQVAAGATSITGFDLHADALLGTAGVDTLQGQGGNDTLRGGLGDDLLYGGLGADTYYYNAGDGNDRIYDPGNYYDQASFDKLVLGAGLTADKLSVAHSGLNLTLSFAGYAGSIYIDAADGDYLSGVEQIVFGDGTIWTEAQLQAAYISQQQTAGNDTILGFRGADTFIGGLGDDTFTGDTGADTYYYNAGDGNDRIFELGSYYDQSSVDKLVLGAGLTADNMILTKSGGGLHLTLTFVGQTGSIYLDNEFNWYTPGIDQINFANGTVWNRTQLVNAANWGTTGNDTTTGTTGNDYFDLKGGTDKAIGTGGSDIYQYRRGYGALEIQNGTASGTTALGNLDFGANISKNDLWLSQSGNDLVINLLGSNDKVTVDGWFGSNGSAKLAEVQTSDGSKLDSGLSQLVSAMASFASTNPGFNPLTATQMPTDPTLQNALASAWH